MRQFSTEQPLFQKIIKIFLILSFGYVVCGMDVVDAIATVATNANDKPLEDVVITSARFVKVK